MDNTQVSYRDIDIALLLADMARAIVDEPDAVSVTEEETADGTVLTLNVAENDMGMIIGKHGKIARALRTVAKAAAKIADRKITVEIKKKQKVRNRSGLFVCKR